MVAAFAAAYMSTIATQLNWGAIYLVNDLYLRFMDPEAPQPKVVLLSRLATALMFLLSSVATYILYQAGSIEGAWRIIIALGAGTGLVFILRWYWWRINAWSEISAMASALVTFTVLVVGGVFNPTDPLEGVYLMLVTTAVTTVVWLVVTYKTAPTATATLDTFYRRVRPGGPGWRAVAERLGFGPEKDRRRRAQLGELGCWCGQRLRHSVRRGQTDFRTEGPGIAVSGCCRAGLCLDRLLAETRAFWQ